MAVTLLGGCGDSMCLHIYRDMSTAWGKVGARYPLPDLNIVTVITII